MIDISKNRKTIRYVLSFCIPFAMYMLIGVLLKLHPFSDNTILCSDLNSQFVHFYNFFKNQFTTNNDFYYTFSKNLGGDMVGFSAYYLQNPFLFLLFLFPYEYMPLGIYIMEALMLSTASLSFMYYLDKVYGKGNLLFSTSYGMMGYVTAYFMLPIYFCNIILLPLVMIGFNLLMTEEKDRTKGKLLYVATIVLSIFCNYYIGYMLCIFLCIYYVYYCICKGSLIRFKDFVVYSIFGVAISLFNLLPVVLSLRDQKDAPASSIFKLGRTFSLIRLYKNLLPGTFNLDSSNSSMPYIYVGLLPLVCICFFIISKKVKVKEKLAVIFIMAVFLISFYIRPINTIWHAFNEPVGFAHRFAFYFSFILITIGYKGYILAESEINCLFEGRTSFRKQKCIIIAVLAISFIELFYNAHHSLKLEAISAAKESDYIEYYNRYGSIIGEIKSLEDSQELYRLEKDTMYTMVDPMSFDYSGLSHNSSCERARVKDFMGKMGFRNQGIWSFYNQGSTAFADSFLAVKYFISRFDSTDKPYDLINSTEDIYVYENPYAIKFASIMDRDSVLSLSKSMDEKSDDYLAKAGSGISNKGNTFVLQNDIAHCYGETKDIFTEAAVSNINVVGNITLSDEFIRHADNNLVNIIRSDTSEGESYVEFNVDVKESGKTLYMYFLAPKMQGARIYVNDIDWDDYFSDWRWAVERVGTYNAGDLVNIKIVSTGDELIIDDYQLYYEDYTVLNEWYEKATELGAESVNLEKVTSSHIVGEFTANEEGMLVFSIPDEKGWKIKIDGKDISHNRVLYVLMGVDISAGEHTIEMRYIPEGLILGRIISIIMLFVFAIVCIKKKDSIKN